MSSTSPFLWLPISYSPYTLTPRLINTIAGTPHHAKVLCLLPPDPFPSGFVAAFTQGVSYNLFHHLISAFTSQNAASATPTPLMLSVIAQTSIIGYQQYACHTSRVGLATAATLCLRVLVRPGASCPAMLLRRLPTPNYFAVVLL